MDNRREARDTVGSVIAALNTMPYGVLLCGLQRCYIIRKLITNKF